VRERERDSVIVLGEMEINWIVVGVTFVVGAIAAYMFLQSQIKGCTRKGRRKETSHVRIAKQDLPSADLLDSTTSNSDSDVHKEAGTFEQIKRLDKPVEVGPRIVHFDCKLFKDEKSMSTDSFNIYIYIFLMTCPLTHSLTYPQVMRYKQVIKMLYEL